MGKKIPGIILMTILFGSLPAQNLFFDFQKEETLTAWAKTKTTTAAFSSDGAVLSGTGWDAKLFKRITLKAGHYVLSASGRGTLTIHLQKSWKDKAFLNLNLSRDTWRKDWRPFDFEGGETTLVIFLGSPSNVTADIQWIRIDAAPIVPDENIPDIALLEKSRPTPALVRGMDIGSFTNLQDWTDLKNTGANVARIFLEPAKKMKALGKSNVLEVWPQVMDDFEIRAKLARQTGIKLVPVLNGNLLGAKAKLNTGKFWEDPELEPLMCRLWKEFAVRFAPYRDVIWGFDLFNEPLDWEQMPHPPRQWRIIATEIVRSIRAVDSEVWIIYETGPGGLGWGFDGLKPLPDTKVIYSTHFYNPHEFTHQGVHNIEGTDLAEAKKALNIRYPSEVNGLLWDKNQIEKDLSPVVAFQKKYRVPIFLGEFSVIRWAPKEDALRYLRDILDFSEKHGWSWSYHAFREFNGWSFEHDEELWLPKMAPPPRTEVETERAKIIKAGLRKNQ